jgi:hypothetical protein
VAKNWWRASRARGASVSTIFHAAMRFIQFYVRPAAFLKFCALVVLGPGGEKLVSSEGGFGFHHFPGHGGGWPAGHFPGAAGAAGYQAWHPGEYSGQHQVILSSQRLVPVQNLWYRIPYLSKFFCNTEIVC